MKKLLVLAVFSVFTLSSFNSSEKAKVVEKKTTKLQKYNFWCANGNYGSFLVFALFYGTFKQRTRCATNARIRRFDV